MRMLQEFAIIEKVLRPMKSNLVYAIKYLHNC